MCLELDRRTASLSEHLHEVDGPAIVSSRHDAAGFSTFYLSHEREPALPLDTTLSQSTPSTSEYSRDAIVRAVHVRQFARARQTVS